MNEKFTWREYWQERNFRMQFIASLGILIGIIIFAPHFFEFIQQRNGAVLSDPLLQVLPPHDLSFFTFLVIYSSVVVAVISFSFYPQILLYSLQAYCLLVIMRMLCIWLVPLDEPPAMVLLSDPFIEVIGYRGENITKDLFFSGHTSTLLLFFFAAPNRSLKFFFLLTSVTVAACVLVQHVHYTIDVLAAPLFSWLSYRICFRRRVLKI